MIEEVIGIVRSRRCFRVVLNREDRFGFVFDAFVRAVVQGAVGCDQFSLAQAFFIHGIAMILARQADFAGCKILHRMICAAVTEFHFVGCRTASQ